MWRKHFPKYTRARGRSLSVHGGFGSVNVRLLLHAGNMAYGNIVYTGYIGALGTVEKGVI